MNDDLVLKLKQLGYSDKQSRVYIALLSLGRASVQSIAMEARLKRPTVYLIIDELIEKGLVSKALGKRKQSYIPIQPDALISQAEKLFLQTKELMPQLSALMGTSNNKKTKTLYFEGMAGIEKALWHEMRKLEGTSIFAFFGTTDLATREMVSLFHRWNKDMYDLGIKLVSIAPKDSDLKKFRTRDLQYGFKNKEISKKSYDSKLSIDITDRFVRIVFFKEKQALIIENEELASALKQIFNLVWGK
jgi:sugar-specific transcriptional regulator TrmB